MQGSCEEQIRDRGKIILSLDGGSLVGVSCRPSSLYEGVVTWVGFGCRQIQSIKKFPPRWTLIVNDGTLSIGGGQPRLRGIATLTRLEGSSLLLGVSTSYIPLRWY